jgi:hypothetical protein
LIFCNSLNYSLHSASFFLFQPFDIHPEIPPYQIWYSLYKIRLPSN